jgi:hypothetical protein
MEDDIQIINVTALPNGYSPSKITSKFRIKKLF